jgi:hypothetical protein
MYQLLLLLTLLLLLAAPRVSSLPEPVKDPVDGGKRHTPEQNRLLSALEAFYYCIVLLGGDVNLMNKQSVGLSPPFRYGRPQTPAEKAAVAARKVQRVVKKRQMEFNLEVQREFANEKFKQFAMLLKVQREVKKEQANKRRWHNSACGVENKRHQSGRWQNNLYGHWEKWTER